MPLATHAGTADAGHGTLAPEHVSLTPEHVSLAQEHMSLAQEHGTLAGLPADLRELVSTLGKRPGNAIRPVIWRLCQLRPFKAVELAQLLGGRDMLALRRKHLAPMVATGHLRLLHPEMERHPGQAYAAGDPLPPQS